MSIGGFRNNGGGGARVVVDIPYNPAPIPAGVLSHPRLPSSTSLPKYMFSSPGLSLGLANIDGQGDMMNRPGPIDFDSPGRNREDEYESRSGSDNLEGGSGDDLDLENQPPHKRKRYHRHTPQQIQELEALFKECPHPDEKQRLELSKRLNLASRQVKFWFQNRRTQMKTQLERHENALLRQENDRLKAENLSMREAMRNPICTNCGGPAMLGEATAEEQHLRVENARLRDELERVCTLAAKFLGRPIPGMGMPNSSLELAVGGNGLNNPTAVAANNTHSTPLPPASNPVNGIAAQMGSIDRSLERSMYLELALAAMDELVRMVQIGEPLWLPGGDDGKDVLNDEEYTRLFSRARPVGLVSEATRETRTVIINSMALVETLMDANQWADMFPCIVTKASTADVISTGVGATRSGALQLMHAELQVLSPLVPIRETNFLRFCKQHAEGVWAVVDISIDGIRDGSPATPPGYMSCRRLPSGCVVQDMPNGCSKVTWVEHAEYDETPVHPLYRAVLRSGMGFGASRWVSTLNRQSQCLAILMSSSMPTRDHAAITPAGRRSMLKLAHRMTDNFCAGVCPSTALNWNRLTVGTIDKDVRVMTRKSVDDPGEPPGVVLSAATSVWLPVSPRRLFDFLRDERLRSEWDILSNGGPMQEMAHIAKGQDPGNCVSLLRASTPGVNQSSMLIVQETCTDASGSLVVYAPVDIPAMHVVMSGGDSGCVALLPSGFAIIPDLAPQQQNGNSQDEGKGSPSPPRRESGSLLTVAFQILVNSLPTAKLTVESVETVSNLITCTVQKIKASLHREDC